MIPSLEKRKKIVRERYRAGYFQLDLRDHGSSLFDEFYLKYHYHGLYVIRIGEDFKTRISGTKYKMYKVFIYSMHKDVMDIKNNRLLGADVFRIKEKEFNTKNEAVSFAQEWYLDFCAVFYKGKIEC